MARLLVVAGSWRLAYGGGAGDMTGPVEVSKRSNELHAWQE
jgi:hypothetical protein